MTHTCKQCGAVFIDNHRDRVYCSRICSAEARTKAPQTCETCGTTFHRKGGSRHPRVFCSRACFDTAQRTFPVIHRDCQHCGETFQVRANKPDQRLCSKRCLGLHLWKHRPEHVAKMRDAARAQYVGRLRERFKGMTAGQIWRMAYERGYSAGYRTGHKNAQHRRAA